MSDRFPYKVIVSKTLEDDDTGIPQMFIEQAQKDSVDARAWLKDRGLEIRVDYDIDLDTYYQGDDRGTKIAYSFADPGIAMVFKLTFAGI